MIMNVSNTESFTHLGTFQHAGYSNVHAGRYNATFKAKDTSVDVYVCPNSTNSSGQFNIRITLYSFL